MRQRFYISVEPDLVRSKQWAIVLRDEDGTLIDTLADNYRRIDAERMLLPTRRAFLAGLSWMRNDASNYLLSLLPEVICQRPKD